MFAGHEAVIEVATCAKRAVNLRTRSVPKGGAPHAPGGEAAHKTRTDDFNLQIEKDSLQ